MTKEEAIGHIQSVRRHCRGPLPPGAQEAIAQAFVKGDAETAQRLDRINRGRRTATTDGPSGPGCGWDVNHAIIAGAWDGEDATVTCPQCGNAISYRAPYFEVTPDTAAELVEGT